MEIWEDARSTQPDSDSKMLFLKWNVARRKLKETSFTDSGFLENSQAECLNKKLRVRAANFQAAKNALQNPVPTILFFPAFQFHFALLFRGFLKK